MTVYNELFLHLNRLLVELEQAQRLMADLQRRVRETQPVAVPVATEPRRVDPLDGFLRAYA